MLLRLKINFVINSYFAQTHHQFQMGSPPLTKYYCPRRPMHNIITKRFALIVTDFPRISVGPENPLRVEKDDTAQLHCNVDSKPSVTSVKWMRDGRFIGKRSTFYKQPIKAIFSSRRWRLRNSHLLRLLAEPSLYLFVIVKFWNLFAVVASGCHFMKLMQVFFLQPTRSNSTQGVNKVGK